MRNQVLKKQVLRILLLAFVLWMPAQQVWANAQFDKALKHFKDFEINDAVKILTTMQGDSTLSKPMQIKVALYLGMSYAYLRKADQAKTSFKQAITLDPGAKLPKGTPARLQKLFESSGGAAGTAPAARVAPPTRAATPPPARRTMSFGGGDPVPVRREPVPVRREPVPVRRDPPPERRGMSFSGFTLRRRPAPPARRAAPTFDPPPQRRAAPTFEPPPRRRAAPTFEPPPRRRETAPAFDPPRTKPPKRVASNLGSSDPDAGGLFGKKKVKKGGGSGLWIAAWATIIGAALLAGGGLGVGAFAQSKRDQAAKSAIQIDVPVAEADAGGFATIANVMFISAGAVGVGAVIFFILAARQPKAPPKTTLGSLTPQPKAPGHSTPLPTRASTHLLSTSHP